MSRNKTTQQVQAEVEALKKDLVTLKNRQMRLNLLHQMQRQGVVRPNWTWFVTGNTK